MKIVFLDADTLGSTPLDSLREFGELVCYGTSTPEQAITRVRDADVIIVNKVKVTDDLLAAAPHLRMVCEAATGVNNIDVEAARRRGIPVRNVSGYSTDSVAQFTFCQMLNLLCDSARLDAECKDFTYSRSNLFTDVSRPYMELAGKTMGIIGMGAIGRKVARIATAFGMKVVYFSTSGTYHCTEYPSLPLNTILEMADVICIHCPLNERTEGMIRAEQLAKMKPSAIVVNMARGGIIDEKDLAAAVSNGVIYGAAVDVFTSEPLPEDHPYLHVSHPERMLLSPHVAWASQDALVRLVEGIYSNIATLSI